MQQEKPPGTIPGSGKRTSSRLGGSDQSSSSLRESTRDMNFEQGEKALTPRDNLEPKITPNDSQSSGKPPKDFVERLKLFISGRNEEWTNMRFVDALQHLENGETFATQFTDEERPLLESLEGSLTYFSDKLAKHPTWKEYLLKTPDIEELFGGDFDALEVFCRCGVGAASQIVKVLNDAPQTNATLDTGIVCDPSWQTSDDDEWKEALLDPSNKAPEKYQRGIIDGGQVTSHDLGHGKVSTHKDLAFHKKGGARQKGGFGMSYEGQEKHRVTFMQFISITVEQKGIPKRDKFIEGGDDRVAYSPDEHNRTYGVDQCKSEESDYPASVESDMGTMMVDDPLPCIGDIRKLMNEGATEVIETDRFDTFACVDGKPVFHMQLDVKFTSKREGESKDAPITKSQELHKAKPFEGEYPEGLKLALARDRERTEKNRLARLEREKKEREEEEKKRQSESK